MRRRVSNESIAESVLTLAKKQDRDPLDVLEDYADIAIWLDRNRLPVIRKIIGQIGGAASKRRAEQRKKEMARKREQARQGRLF